MPYHLVCISRTGCLVNIPGNYQTKEEAAKACKIWFAYMSRCANARRVVMQETK